MTNEERLKLFEDYTNRPRFEYNPNGPDQWVCQVCGYQTDALYVEPGKLEECPSIDKIEHSLDCPHHPENA